MIRLIFAVILCLSLGAAVADTPRQECLGRLTFDVPEEIEWATFHADYIHRVSDGGGHGFGLKVGAKGDLASYDFNGLIIHVSDIVERSEFEAAVGYQKGTGMRYKRYLLEKLETNRRLLEQFETGDYPKELVTDRLEKIAAIEKDIPLTIPSTAPWRMAK